MNVIRFAIHNPVTVIVGVLLVVLFGITSLLEIPVQLSPNIERPIVTVNTTWPGASPYEIERTILEEQERRLKTLPGLYEMESIARDNRGRVVLTFDVGIDQDAALMRVSQKLDEVPSYPENVDQPVITAAGSERSPVMWLVLRTLEDNETPINEYLTYFEEYVRQYIERVDGIAELLVGGGTANEMQIVFSPVRLAEYGMTIDSVVSGLRDANANVSAGNLNVGRRSYRVRTYGEYQSVEEIRNVVLRAQGDRIVTVGDVAEVRMGFAQHTTPVMNNHQGAISIRVLAEARANILEVTDNVAQVIDDLNESLLAGQGLQLEMVNEQRPYIRGAIALLQQNILIGGILAIAVLLLFLRSLAPTLVVSATIPISIIGTFGSMYFLGSTLNAISLAGIAFAVGMLLDNAIVVLENIDRHRHMGKSPLDAAFEGTREVWGAVLASSLTTIAVFLPVIFLEDEAGQLFRDIAVAVTSAVTLSLLSAMTLIPALATQVLGLAEKGLFFKKKDPMAKGAKPGVAMRLGRGIRDGLVFLVRCVLYNWVTRLALIVVLVGSAVLGGYLLLPKAEYLPQGNRDLITNVLILPPGLSVDEREAIGTHIFEKLTPYYEAGYEGYPGIRNAFYLGGAEFSMFGLVSEDPLRARELMPLAREIIASIPGVFGTTSQASIFPGGVGAGRSITVNLGGDEIENLVETAQQMFSMILEKLPGSQVRPRPPLELLYPEINFVPDRVRLANVGMTAQQLGVGLDVLMEGRKIGEFKQEGRRTIDMTLMADRERILSPEDLNNALIAVPTGETLPVASLARMEERTGLNEIRRYEQERTIYLLVSPPDNVSQQEVMEFLEDEIFPSMEAAGQLEGIHIRLSGAADSLNQTRQALQYNFLLAMLISYLLMSALLGNFLYPIVIMFTVPMAAAGGLLGFRLVDLLVAPQQFDVLTMLGFVILIGVVVNNAILIVYQSLNNIRFEKMLHREAVLESVRTRIRPIYMSALTSLFGMLPLILWPGPGSELYRGLGSVVLGGLALSTVFTIFLIPALLMFFIRWEKIPADDAIESPKSAA